VSRHGVFAGLCTFDLIQQVERLPGPNEKVTAVRQEVAAGGPATNGAATFARLGGTATLITAVGRHPLAAGITADLADLGVRLVDLAADDPAPPAVSSILVTAGTGARSVVSRNAAGRNVTVAGWPDVGDAAVVLVDGHHPALARAALGAHHGRVTTVLDGGSWKPHLPELLPLIDVAVCSADLRPPTGEPTLAYLRRQGVPWVAVTDGPNPVRWAGPDGTGGDVIVPPVAAVDTSGAGDVFHGAFAYAVAGAGALDVTVFTAALAFAAGVAARSCRSFGTRSWMRDGTPRDTDPRDTDPRATEPSGGGPRDTTPRRRTPRDEARRGGGA
jgi:sugar/nucleoside kinase (ribokinase family)